jgi:uncharacterized repeat protein (TIGR03843 family)
MSNSERVPDLTPPVALPVAEALELLTRGELRVEGRVTVASNATFYAGVAADGRAAGCVYKPISGERPLWDFPDGTLAQRELATYLVSAASGWDLVPPTVLRDGPLGPGMVQLWIAGDDDFDLVGAINSGAHPALRRMALLDAVVNNSDRKVSHLLPVPATVQPPQHIYGVDHGVSFSAENKLRTVLWQWAGEPVVDDEVSVLSRLSAAMEAELGTVLGELLTVAEVRATRRRLGRLLRDGRFPMPSRNWPSVPYPPY